MAFRLLSQRVDASIDLARGTLSLAAACAGAGKIRVDLRILSIAACVVVFALIDGLLGAAQLVMRTLQVCWRVTLCICLVRLFNERPGLG
ncbi:MAG TPA: hypothetical protein VK820_04445 [Steroidobacteraceae bacterium]|jgi:hypothetical protein|nr:hypothetical protein [Steroidobacteraceae bacterium]